MRLHVALLMALLAGCGGAHGFETPRDQAAQDECARYVDELADRGIACDPTADPSTVWATVSALRARCAKVTAFYPFGDSVDSCIDKIDAMTCDDISKVSALEARTILCNAFIETP